MGLDFDPWMRCRVHRTLSRISVVTAYVSPVVTGVCVEMLAVADA